METFAAISSVLSLVESFAPLVPEVIEAAPTIVADVRKAAADVKALNVTATVADIENTLSAIPAGVVSKVVEASKGIKL